VGKDRLVRFWDVASGGERASCQLSGDPLALALSPDGNVLATGGYGNRLALCADRGRGRPTTELPVSWTVRALAFTPSGSQLVAACDSGMLRVWDVGPGGDNVRPYRTLRRGRGKGRAAVFARRGALLVTASEEDGTVEFWDPRRLGGCETIPSLPPGISDVALSPDGRAASSHGGQVCLLDLEHRRIERLLPIPAGGFGLAFAPDGRTVAASADDQVRLWDVASDRQILTLDHGACVKALAFSPTGGLVATAGADGTARLWHLPSGALCKTCVAHSGCSLALAFAPDGRTLAVAGSSHSVAVGLWDPSTGEGRGSLTDPGSAFTHGRSGPPASPSGEPGLSIGAVAFAADGATLAAGCSDGVIRLWDVSSGELRLTLSGHTDTVRRLAFAADGRTLASLGHDNVLNLWHLGTGQQLFTLDTQGPEPQGLAFSGDGRLLVAGGRPLGNAGPSSLLLWRAEPAGP
jgi:WD40 repeat protein